MESLKLPSADETAELSRLVHEARNIVCLTGAGISTESGIPDFRSPGGVWSKYRIIEYQDFLRSPEARLEDWQRRFDMDDVLEDADPNKGHMVLADWVRVGKCSTIITQNIDGLHQASGVPQDALIEIHGSARHANCVSCGKRHEITECRTQIRHSGKPPVCSECGGIVKSAVVMFGQSMPEKETEAAFEAAQTCDLFIAIGTSLVVYPAAGLPLEAKKAGAKLVIISGVPTELDGLADLAINAGAGLTLTTAWPISPY